MLKNLLRALSNSLVKTSWEQQKIKGNVISIRISMTPGSDNRVYATQVAPCDGYAIVAAWNVATVAIRRPTQFEYQVGTAWGSDTLGDFRVGIPCKKGEELQGLIARSNLAGGEAADGYFYFFPKVGSN